MLDLGTLNGPGTLNGQESEAVAINERGQVVGSSSATSGLFHAFLWQDGEMLDLGTLGGYQSAANGINEPGQIVGWSTMANGHQHAFLWQDGHMADLGTLGGVESSASDINEQGQVVGASHIASGATRPFLWQDGQMIDLGALGGFHSVAYGINERGQVVGWSEIAGAQERAVLWEPRPSAFEVAVDIGSGGTAAAPINIKSNGLIPVAILSTATFDATTIDPTSVCFGDAEDTSQRDCTEAHGRGHREDINGDGRADLVLHFETQQTGIDKGDTEACLTGETREGDAIQGCDAIRAR